MSNPQPEGTDAPTPVTSACRAPLFAGAVFDPLLTWQMFPQNNQWLSSNLTYLTILQPLHALIADALAARARQRSPTFAQGAAGRAAAELMSAAITEWSRRGGRVKLARLVAKGRWGHPGRAHYRIRLAPRWRWLTQPGLTMQSPFARLCTAAS
jgi:hypothetical protein